MRKIAVLSFVTLDGVMQAPGGPDEDTSGGFKYGGWSFGYWDDVMSQVMAEQMGKPFDLLVGRKTYDIFSAYWPTAKEGDIFKQAKKYVVSATPGKFEWENTVRIGSDAAEEIRKLKNQDGPELQVHGSSELIQLLLEHDLVDELRLKIFPVTVGGGKRLFGSGTIPASFKLTAGRISTTGVFAGTYERQGEIRTGSFG